MPSTFRLIFQRKEENIMKACPTCGTTLNDNAAFCQNCGSNVAPSYPVYPPMVAKQPITVGGWIGRSLIPLIPVVGWIIYLVMLFIWSGDTAKEDSFRNWAKSQLILMAIGLVLSILFIVVFGVAFVEIFKSMEYMY